MKLIPAIRGKIGSTEYFVATMKASEVVNSVRIPKEMPDWGKESIEDRYQREINYKRVKEQIAPYFAMDEDRFFNALIVDILDPESVKFDKLSDAIKNIPSYMGSLGDNFGILTLNGSERLVPLDGQHRLAALKFALYGRDEKDQAIDTFHPNAEIGKDDITLILIKHDRVKARKIFSKVNRYAKAVSKADNLIISEDDYMAILSRGIANDTFKSLVNSKSNTISDKSNDITTLSALYEGSIEYISESPIYPAKVTTDFLPDLATQALWKSEVEKMWDLMLASIPPLVDAIKDPSDEGQSKRVELRETYIIMKPVVQVALVMAIKRMIDGGSSLKSAFQKAGKLDWRFECTDWDRVAVNPGEKIIAGKQSQKLLSRIIAYRLGEELTAKELKVLEEQYDGLFDTKDPNRKLPSKIN
jgi:DNA sulfur modification protein DndB